MIVPSTIHAEYGGVPVLVPFEGTRDELEPGTFLGYRARPELMVAGDIVTGVSTGQGQGTAYYYDPRLLIEGSSFVRTEAYAHSSERSWLWVNRR